MSEKESNKIEAKGKAIYYKSLPGTLAPRDESKVKVISLSVTDMLRLRAIFGGSLDSEAILRGEKILTAYIADEKTGKVSDIWSNIVLSIEVNDRKGRIYIMKATFGDLLKRADLAREVAKIAIDDPAKDVKRVTYDVKPPAGATTSTRTSRKSIEKVSLDGLEDEEEDEESDDMPGVNEVESENENESENEVETA